MIDIMIDKRCIFIHSVNDLCIGIFAHQNGRFEGPVHGPCGWITFETPELVYEFKEQLELLIDGLEEEEEKQNERYS